MGTAGPHCGRCGGRAEHLPCRRRSALRPGGSTQKEYAMAATPTWTEPDGGKKRRRRSIVLDKVDMLVAALGALLLTGAYQVGFLPEALALVLLSVVLATTGSRAWQA